jgi:hypothetical protein
MDARTLLDNHNLMEIIVMVLGKRTLRGTRFYGYRQSAAREKIHAV